MKPKLWPNNTSKHKFHMIESMTLIHQNCNRFGEEVWTLVIRIPRVLLKNWANCWLPKKPHSCEPSCEAAQLAVVEWCAASRLTHGNEDRIIRDDLQMRSNCIFKMENAFRTEIDPQILLIFCRTCSIETPFGQNIHPWSLNEIRKGKYTMLTVFIYFYVPDIKYFFLPDWLLSAPQSVKKGSTCSEWLGKTSTTRRHPHVSPTGVGNVFLRSRNLYLKPGVKLLKKRVCTLLQTLSCRTVKKIKTALQKVKETIFR